MNNDAFQKLVRERATEKSSKEIARDAVEQEFQQNNKRNGKRKRRRGAGGSSDEDDDDSDMEDDPKQKKDEKQKEQKQQQDQSKQGAGKKEKVVSKYRDRAKERREGDNADYQDSQRLLAGVAAAAEEGEDDDLETISKFLGGDEAYTHLVKGLDVTLAKQSVRKQNASISMQPRKAGNVSDSVKRPYFAENKTDAKELIGTDLQLESELGREMMDYLCNYHASTRDSSKAVAVTPAGLVVQRSTLTFSLQANPGEFVRSWEVPREQTYATASDGTAYTKASPLSIGLLDRIENALARQMSLASEQTKLAGPLARATTDARGEEDSEDDIFGSVGDYVPSHEPDGDSGAVIN
jgi:hypothetical protein